MLYPRAVEAASRPSAIGAVAAGLWERFAGVDPGADFTRIYPFVEDSK
jgi:3-hydroxyisobutyrate dehydrogenase